MSYGVFRCVDCRLRWPGFIPDHGEPWVRCPYCASDTILAACLYERHKPELVHLLVRQTNHQLTTWSVGIVASLFGFCASESMQDVVSWAAGQAP